MIPRSRAPQAWALVAAAIAAAATAALAQHYSPVSADTVSLVLALVAGVAIVLATATLPPSWTMTGGLLLSAFSSNWGQFGLPGGFAPDRLLIIAGLVSLWDRRRLAGMPVMLGLRPVHLVMLAASAYAIGSAVAVGTWASDGLLLVDRLGLTGFVVFAVAPLVFRTRSDRDALLYGMVGLGAYLGLTALLEITGPRSLVWPGYITDPSVGIHFGRARGPFVEAEVNGLALFACLIATVIAYRQTRPGLPRLAIAAIGLLCALGVLFTLSRSVWLAAVAGMLVAMIGVRELRRRLPAVVLLAAAVVGLSLVAVPGLATRAQERRANQRTIWDRQNLTTAALRMARERPLTGFGWATFSTKGSQYFWQGDVPLTAGSGTIVHNAVLANVAELGLIGTALWLAAIAIGIGGAVLTRGPPEVEAWRIGLVAIAVSWAAMALFTPMLQPIESLLMWMWAGVVVAARPPARGPAA